MSKVSLNGVIGDRRGSILLEGALSLILIVLALGANFELIRRVYFSTTLHYGAFDFGRTQVLGWGRSAADIRVKKFFKAAWSSTLTAKLWAGMDRQVLLVNGREVESRFYMRYPAFLILQMEKFKKHHLEVTEKCRFPF